MPHRLSVKNVLIVAQEGGVAPRFDLAVEAVVSTMSDDSRQNLILPQSSAEELCHLIMKENIHDVVCGGIEEEFFQYLTWKKVRVLDNVIGPVDWALERWKSGRLQAGDVFRPDGDAPVVPSAGD